MVVARLRDGKFFWDEDLKKPLGRRVHELAGVSFHEKLGTYEEQDRSHRSPESPVG